MSIEAKRTLSDVAPEHSFKTKAGKELKNLEELLHNLKEMDAKTYSHHVNEHKNDFVAGFTKKYAVHTLVYFEECDDREAAVLREKQIKEWKRRWKLEMIEKVNPEWEDLYGQIS